MTDAPTTTDSPRIAAAAAPGADPLGRLYHMSTTAGITGQEYVAINLPSVFSTLLGLASLAVLIFHQWVLLVIPLAAIAFGVAALRQIRDSNGTQTGRAFAWVGIVLALLLGGGEMVAKVTEGQSEKKDQTEIARLFQTLGDHVGKRDYASAYALFTERFRQRVSREQFDAQWDVVQTGVSPINKIDWNGVKMYFELDGSGTMMGTAMAVFHFSKTPDNVGRQACILRHEPAGWQIDDIPALFPQKKPAR